MYIRPERPADYDSITHVNNLAFGKENESFVDLNWVVNPEFCIWLYKRIQRRTTQALALQQCYGRN
jgi:hypothetical protein